MSDELLTLGELTDLGYCESDLPPSHHHDLQGRRVWDLERVGAEAIMRRWLEMRNEEI
jgi:hypothetical protein